MSDSPENHFHSQMSSSSCFANLCQQIDNFQALLTAAAAANNVRNYDIRQCLRQIQSCLLGEQGDLLYEQNDSAEVTQALMTLLVLNDEYSDPMILEMVNEISQRAADLVSCCAREVSPQQIQELLPRVIFLLQNTNTEDVVNSLLQLLNQHISVSLLQEIFDGNDLDRWITLQATLVYQQHHRSDTASFLSLSGFIVTLLDHLAIYALNPQKLTLPDWIHSQVLEQYDNISPMEATQIVREYMESLEQFGVFLFESVLQLLEQSAHEEIGEDNQMDINTAMMVLQFSAVATDCIRLCIPQEDGNPPLLEISCGGILTSLWQALTYFVVQKLESIATTIPGSDQYDGASFQEQQMQMRFQMQLSATEALWRLTFVGTTNKLMVLEESFSPMVVVTVLRMLQFPETFWTTQAQDWLKEQLSQTPYRISLRRSLQATTLSQVYNRSGANAKDQIAALLHEVLNYETENDDDDPWQPLVQELLSEHLALVQGAARHSDQF